MVQKVKWLFLTLILTYDQGFKTYMYRHVQGIRNKTQRKKDSNRKIPSGEDNHMHVQAKKNTKKG